MGRIVSRFDKDLADYRQYAELKEAICEGEHSLVVLTGDVHFGRVASTLPGPDRVTKLVEVVSSPMCLVTGGIPLMRDGEVVGAIGVSGGTVDEDQEVAEAGVAAFG